MTSQADRYDENMACVPQNGSINPVSLWRTLERTHDNLFAPPGLIERFVLELARIAEREARERPVALVVIDGVEYVPRGTAPEVTDAALKAALGHLVAIQYFDEGHKNRAVAWNALNALAPELAQLAAADPKAAYDLTRTMSMGDDTGILKELA